MMQCEGEARSPNLGKGVKMGLVLAPEGAMALYRRLTNVQTARLLQSIETTRGTMVHEALSGRVDLVLAKRLKEAYAESLASPLPIWVGAADQRSRASGVRSQVAKNLPLNSFGMLPEGAFVPSPALTVVGLAGKHSFLFAVECACELCATYRKDSRDLRGMNERKPVLSAQAVHDLADADPRIDGIGKARNLSRYIVEDSGSPMETAVALLLSLPVRRGGAGLPKPKMNGIVDLPADIRRLAQRSYLKADLLWRAKKVAVEYDSDLVHGNAKALNSDAARRNALCHLGYTVVTLTREQLFDWRRFEEFVAVLSRLLRSQPSRAKRDWTQQRFAVWSALLRANPQNACYMG